MLALVLVALEDDPLDVVPPEVPAEVPPELEGVVLVPPLLVPVPLPFAVLVPLPVVVPLPLPPLDAGVLEPLLVVPDPPLDVGVLEPPLLGVVPPLPLDPGPLLPLVNAAPAAFAPPGCSVGVVDVGVLPHPNKNNDMESKRSKGNACERHSHV